MFSWRWDNRVHGRVICLVGIPNVVFIGKAIRKPLEKRKHSPTGAVSDSDEPERSPVRLRKRWDGGRLGLVLPQAGTEGPVPAGCMPGLSFFLTHPQPESSAPPPLFPGRTLTPPRVSLSWAFRVELCASNLGHKQGVYFHLPQ